MTENENATTLPFGTLNIDTNVELPDRKLPVNTGRASVYAGYHDSLVALPVGDGFFIPKPIKETNGLYTYAKSINVNLARGFTENDSVYGQAGTRFVRISDAAAARRKKKPKTAPAGTGQDSGAQQTAAATGDDNDL